MAFLRLLILLKYDFGLIEPVFGSIEPTSLLLICFYPKLEFFVLGFNVDHSKLIRPSFCHVLSWFVNITNSKPNNIQWTNTMKKVSK